MRVADLTARDVERWRALADRALEPNVYLDPRWLIPSQRLHPDAGDLMVLLAEDDDALRGLLAFTVEPAWRGLPFRAVSTAGRFLGTHAERHHPLVDRDAVDATVDALLSGVGEHGLPGLLVLHKFVGDGPLADALAATLSRHGMREEEVGRRAWAFARAGYAPPTPGRASADRVEDRQGVELPAELALPTAGAKAVRNLRRSIRGLQAAVDEPVALMDRSDESDRVGAFLALQSAGWKGDAAAGGLAMGLAPATAGWFRAIAEAFQADGDLRLFSLEAGDEVLHMAVNLRSGDGVFGFIDSYDERFSRFSVGHIGRVLGLARMSATDAERFFDPDLDPFYTSGTGLYPDRRDRVDLLVGTSASSRLLLRALPLARRVRDRARRGVRASG
ncbi:hypothetical protein GCM10022202_28610 [Microbacterium marinilacus]|uniref:BioF2-like acetyltransferase domain-containing protein n=1 Tax=Microbacterium marinilacus TaxID=415209 RepID=A0ABP7BPG7_9MICO